MHLSSQAAIIPTPILYCILFKSHSPLSLQSDSLEIFTHPSNSIKINWITFLMEYWYFFYKSRYVKEYD